MDEGFNPLRFIDPQLRRERTLSENKQELYILQEDRSASQEERQKQRESLAEFVRDVIALANAARQRGKSAYLLFGITDIFYDLLGINDQCFNPKVPASRGQEKLHEINKEVVRRVLEEYIAPTDPVFEYWEGRIDGKEFAYLEIHPQPTPAPYQVKKDLLEIDWPLREGLCWVRKGENKGKPIPEHQKQFIYAWTQVPHVEKQEWIAYLEKCVNLPGPSAQNIERGRQILYANTALPLEEEFNQFIADDSTSLLVIEGAAGCGKSAFVRDLFRHLADNLLQELSPDEMNPDSQNQVAANLDFQNQIPVFVYLNPEYFTIQADEPFARKILQRMEGGTELEFYRANEPEKIFTDKGKRWIVLLDAFDETRPDEQHRANLWAKIHDFVHLYPNVQVVLTTRPDALPPPLHQRVKNISINPLTQVQVLSFLQAQMSDDTNVSFEKIIDFLNKEDELWRHLQTPLFMSKTAFYFVGEEAPSATEENLPVSAAEQDSLVQPVPKFNQEENQAVGARTEFNLKSITGFVNEQLTDEAEDLYEVPDLPRDKPLDLEEAVEDKLRMGIFLHQVFEALWEHNRKKILAGFQCGQKDDTFEMLGEMAARNPQRPLLRKTEVEQYISDAIDCVLDLGILIIQRGRLYQFPTSLSKSYFTAFFVDVLLKAQSPDIEGLVVPPVTFWERCLKLLKDISDSEDTSNENYLSPFIQQLDKLKGEVTNG